MTAPTTTPEDIVAVELESVIVTVGELREASFTVHRPLGVWAACHACGPVTAIRVPLRSLNPERVIECKACFT